MVQIDTATPPETYQIHCPLEFRPQIIPACDDRCRDVHPQVGSGIEPADVILSNCLGWSHKKAPRTAAGLARLQRGKAMLRHP